MSKGYSAHVGAAERKLREAVQHITLASRAQTRPDRGMHLGWALAMAESAIASLRKADPVYIVTHATTGPVKAAEAALTDESHDRPQPSRS